MFIFAIFYILFFNDFEYEKLRSFIKKSIDQIISSYEIQKSNDIDRIIKVIMMILPSVNSLIFFTTFSLILILLKFILKKFEIRQSTTLNLTDFTTPLWFSFIYLIILFCTNTEPK